MTRATALSLLCLGFLSHCSDAHKKMGIHCFKSAGSTRSDFRKLSNFSKIHIEGSADLVVEPDSNSAVLIRAGKEVLDDIETRVEGDTLVIENTSCIMQPGSIKVWAKTQKVEELVLDGSGSISMNEGLPSSDLNLEINGSGDIEARGSGEHLTAKIKGSGDIKAFSFEAQHVDAEIAGSGDIEVTAQQTLKGKISGSGDIHYRGDAKVESDVDGSGSIEKS